MLKAYCYTDDEIKQAFGFTPEQLERARVKLPQTFQLVNDIGSADCIWIQADMGHVEAYHGGARSVATGAQKLPHWAGNEQRHVMYFCSDGAEPTGLPSIMFRQSFYKQRADKNVVAWPYAVEDFSDCVTDDFSTLPYAVSFVGSRVSHPSRIQSFESIQDTPQLRSFLDDSKLHWGSIEHTEVGKQRKELFIKSLRESKMVLATRGGGLSCYRFFEAMSAGRIPILIADDWELPNRMLIDWRKCIVQIQEKHAAQTGPILANWLATKKDDELAEMGKAAREAWVKYLAPTAWGKMMKWHIRRVLNL